MLLFYRVRRHRPKVENDSISMENPIEFYSMSLLLIHRKYSFIVEAALICLSALADDSSYFKMGPYTELGFLFTKLGKRRTMVNY